MKATYGIVNGEPIMIYKDPKTDTSHLKKSHKGCCCIYHDDNGELQCMDGFNDVFRDGVLRTVFKDGEMYHKETFEDIRELLPIGEYKTWLQNRNWFGKIYIFITIIFTIPAAIIVYIAFFIVFLVTFIYTLGIKEEKK